MSGSTSGKRRLNHHSKSWEASDSLFLNEQNHLRYMDNPIQRTKIQKDLSDSNSEEDAEPERDEELLTSSETKTV
ncbi:hypothetical protein TNCV_2935551 [Trichonephila clavipes]|nr:hypothetical protein TNCV_2935551 [Trichonephila clavipes]